MTSSGQQTVCHLWVEAKSRLPPPSISSSAKMALEAVLMGKLEELTQKPMQPPPRSHLCTE